MGPAVLPHRTSYFVTNSPADVSFHLALQSFLLSSVKCWVSVDVSRPSCEHLLRIGDVKYDVAWTYIISFTWLLLAPAVSAWLD